MTSRMALIVKVALNHFKPADSILHMIKLIKLLVVTDDSAQS